MPSLAIISEKSFPGTTRPAVSDLVAYCDTHDLVAIAAETHDVVIYRITGHAAFTIKRRNGEAEVTALKWKQDGSVLAVGWNDGTYGLHSGETGRLLSQGSVRGGGREREWRLDLMPDYGDDEDDEGGPVVTQFGWEWHATSVSNGVRGDSNGNDSSLTTEDWCDGAEEDPDHLNAIASLVDGNERDAILALTTNISALDVITVLPKLSAIPSHGLRAAPDGNKFGTQAITDTVFASPGVKHSNVDALLICSSDGHVQVLQDETVKIGTVGVGSKPVMHASCKSSACHSVLCQDDTGELHANFIDLPLHTLGGSLFDVIATNTKRIQNLLAYITQTIRCIQHDFTTGLQFPTRIMTNMNAELAEKQEGDVVTNLYHLAMTSDFTPTMLEWLVDIVKETNHKRWDQAVNAMYTNIHNHLFFNLLPALNRLSIATTTLRGHARFHEGTSNFEAPPALFTQMLEGIDSLRLVAQKMQLLIMTEHRQFRAFSKWTRVMIEIGVAGPGSTGAIETEEREVPNFDYPLLLAYIQDTLTRSQLTRHIVQPTLLQGTRASRGMFFAHPFMEQLGYERTKEALRRLGEVKLGEEFQWTEACDAEALVNLPALGVGLAASVRVAMESVAVWQGKMLTAPTSVAVGAAPDAVVLDLRMEPHVGGEAGRSTTTVLLLSPENTAQLLVLETAHSARVSRDEALTTGSRTIGLGYEVLDASFHALQPALIALVRDEAGGSLLLRHSLPSAQDNDDTEITVLHTFPPSSDSGFEPQKLVIGGRPGKMVCVVFGNEGREWRALDLDFVERGGDGGGAVTTEEFMEDGDGGGDAEMSFA
ncbi:hypothetical protein LTR08_000918 [Meristemomyces frigidus]|nr:hypothetical protein LTR08_000918 [Meristemomyces frigidus]